MGKSKEEFTEIREQEVNENQGLSFEVKSLLQADKEDITTLSKHLVGKVAGGEVDPYKAYIHNKKILELATANEKNLRPFVNSKGIPKAGLTMYNVAFVSKSDADTYDYEACEDAVWNDLQNELKELKKKIKTREDFLKAIEKDLSLVNEETFEVYVIHPPKKITGKENFSSSIK